MMSFPYFTERDRMPAGPNVPILQGSRAKRSLVVLATVVIGVTASVATYLGVHSIADARLHVHFQHMAGAHARAVTASIERNLEIVESVAGLFVASEQVTEDEFRVFAGRELREPHNLRALGWSPRVEAPAPPPAKARFPVRYLDGSGAHDLEVGRDLATDPGWATAIGQAVEAGSLAAVPVADEAAEGDVTVLVLSPVYRGGAVPTRPALRRQMVDGVVFGVFRLGETVEKASDAPGVPMGADAYVFEGAFQDAAAANGRLLYYRPSGLRTAPSRPSLQLESGEEPSFTVPIRAGAREWTVALVAAPEFAARHRSFEPDIVLLGGLLITGLVLVYVVLSSRRLGEIESLAAEISSANERLQAENAERRSAERELRAREEYIRGVMDNVVDAIVTIDEDGAIESFNASAERIFGYAEGEVRGRNVALLMPEPYRSEHQGHLRYYRRTGRGEIIGGGPSELQALRKDGSTLPVELAISEMQVGGRRLFIGALRDISRRKALETYLNQYLKLSDDLFCVAGFDGYFNWLSTAWERCLGHRREELMDRPFGDFVHPDDRAATAAELEKLTKGGTVNQFENRYIANDGTYRWLSWNAAPAVEDELVYATARDVTENKATEAQLQLAQKMEAVGQLTGGVAHDFNNLLTVILGNLQLLERFLPDDERMHKYVSTAEHAAQRGAELTKQLLAVSRRQILEPEVLNLNDLVSRMSDLLHHTLRGPIEVETILAEGLWPARVDPGQLESALLNLAINARDAMPDGGRLTIESANVRLDEAYAARHPDVNAGEYAMLAISDTGTGMPPDVVEHALDPFFTTKDVGRGTGLGLSMVYGFVKQSGGHLGIYSEEGRGTTVRVYLPKAEVAGRDAEAEPPAADAHPAGSETVLVVEDDADVRETTVAALESLGYRVLAAADGTEALALLDRNPDVDLLFTDVVMPGGVDGVALAQTVRERVPGIKVLYTSGYAENAFVHGGIADEGAECLGKPYMNADLARKVRHVLERGDR